MVTLKGQIKKVWRRTDVLHTASAAAVFAVFASFLLPELNKFLSQQYNFV